MSRPLRALALSTALALVVTAAPVAAFAAPTDDLSAAPSRADAAPSREVGPATPFPSLSAGSFSAPATTASGRTASRTARTERAVAKHWPVRLRTGRATHRLATPSGDPSQNIVSAKMVQDRLTGRLYADVVLAGTPTAATDSRLRVGFGRYVTDTAGTYCSSPGGAYVDVSSYGASEGAQAKYYVPLDAMKTGTFNCALAGVLSLDGATTYDLVQADTLTEARQRPLLEFRFKGKRLKPRGYTRVPIRIVNRAATVATAPKVRLIIKTRGVSVRYNPRVGTIKPGQAKRGVIFVKDTRRGVGKVTLIAKSREYRKKVTVKVREVRR